MIRAWFEPQPAAFGESALTAARVFDGEAMLNPPTVLVNEGKVVAAGAAVPESVPIVD